MSIFGNGSCFIISDVRVQGSHKHQRVVHKVIDSIFVGLQTLETVFNKRLATISDESDRMKDVSSYHGFEDV